MSPSRGGDVHARVLVVTAVTDGATPLPARSWWYPGQELELAGAGAGVAAPAPAVTPPAPPVTQSPAARASMAAGAPRGKARIALRQRSGRQMCAWRNSDRQWPARQ